MGGGKRQRSGNSDGNQGKKKKWAPQNKNGPVIPDGSKGFLISCVGGKEQLASREAIELLKQYIEKDAEPTPAAAVGADISALIAEEVADLQNKDAQPLRWLNTGIHGLLYIAINKDTGLDPVKLVDAMAKDIKQSRQCKSRLCMRFNPVQYVCNANLEDIQKLGARIVPEVFSPLDEGADAQTFAVQYEHRASASLDRMSVINAFVNHMPKGYKVSLDAAQHTIIVQLIKSCCAVSVVQAYKDLAKYNIRELCDPTPAEEKERAAAISRAAAAKRATAEAGATKSGAAEQPADGPAAAGGGSTAADAPAAEDAAAEAGDAAAGAVNGATAATAAVGTEAVDGDPAAVKESVAAADGTGGSADHQGGAGDAAAAAPAKPETAAD